ncbi:phospholipid scramblase [Plakobranchus ocellatus]|uniref:Phospholipid scramblase n=1 Tax=Plakobranchus ocellatus TaxID=259542 RepID=A0AAV3YMD5_9GAST|nr:phospholipid scramblase [Plakobranchus ocellatus]
MTISQDYRCYAGCCSWCGDACWCMYPFLVKDKFGQLLGVARTTHFMRTAYVGIFDEDGALLYKIKGPCGPPVCSNDNIDFPITKIEDNSKVGTISKTWGGYCVGRWERVDVFSVHFPSDMEEKHKALIIATALLVDAAVFDQTKLGPLCIAA